MVEHAPAAARVAAPGEARAGAIPDRDTAVFDLVTVLYRSAEGLERFLAGLRAQDLPAWRLHVVDNASPDNSAEIVARQADPRIRLIRNARNLGFARAANQGLRAGLAAGGDCLVLINNDTMLAPDFLHRLKAARDAAGAEVFAPRVMQEHDPATAWYAGGHFQRGWLFRNVHEAWDPAAGEAPRQVEFASGCCLGLSRRVLEQVGLLDESFFVYWKDADFCLRLEQAGIPVWYMPAVSLLHAGSASAGGEWSPTHLWLYYSSYAQCVRKHFGGYGGLRQAVRMARLEGGRADCAPADRLRIWRAVLAGLVRPLRPVPRL